MFDVLVDVASVLAAASSRIICIIVGEEGDVVVWTVLPVVYI